MDLSAAHAWIMERAPIVAKVYQNKYVAMLYDRFASLPPKKQRQVLLGIGATILALATITLGSSYWTYWSTNRRARQNSEMIAMLQRHQKQRRDRSAQIQELERNKQLSSAGQLKQHLLSLARTASISPRMVQIEEQADNVGSPDNPKSVSEIKVKRATAKLQRVNLTQVKSFLQAVEFGQYGLTVSSLRMMNDDKIRGYLNVEIGVLAYLFEVEEVG
jgi:hypothetical protein